MKLPCLAPLAVLLCVVGVVASWIGAAIVVEVILDLVLKSLL